ncbi:hypothetical protein O2W15_12695 [Modestobacter sp. VKM Ac-2979]|uniref:hypothetical protein n=1 Tax=unclassified Modestobacter TaxID=2643866 RepID=UPI0022ABBF65|nr:MULTISPECIES: hypothetical protein [unclassified Modestobacter]MCZ2812292.1 hypothetical protein [Modestobacter sp. VKM Ac-2979]MCZ2841182.1 hypothetical protein [Modestobacter sp. VKM Ac-2980]
MRRHLRAGRRPGAGGRATVVGDRLPGDRPLSERERPGRHLARRVDADRHAFLLLVGFAGSIVVTRAYLALTGYPTVGGDTLHIAHAVWGGLLLTIGAGLALTMVNRSVLPWAALLAGVGAGLFFDEIGKFITVDNDYFFAAAAPIAYLLFVASLLLFLRLRRRRDQAPAAQLHAAVELLSGVVDHDLSRHDRRRLEHRLEVAVGSSEPQVHRLAGELLALTREGAFDAAVEPVGPVHRVMRRAADALADWSTPRRVRVLLAVSVGVLGVATVADLALVGLVATDLAGGTANDLAAAVDEYVVVDVLDDLGVVLFACRIVLDAVLGVVLLIAAVLLARGRDRRGTGVANAALLAALLTVDVLFFWSEQFAAAGLVLVHLLLLAAVRHHRRTLGLDRTEPAGPDAGAAVAVGGRAS